MWCEWTIHVLGLGFGARMGIPFAIAVVHLETKTLHQQKTEEV